jgi:hypothetical protein
MLKVANPGAWRVMAIYEAKLYDQVMKNGRERREKEDK